MYNNNMICMVFRMRNPNLIAVSMYLIEGTLPMFASYIIFFILYKIQNIKKNPWIPMS